MKQNEKQVILLVFPGLGKTTAAKKLPGLADCDYGYYRSSWPNRYDTACLMSFCQKVINIYSKEGFVVLTNYPDLIPWMKQGNERILMVLPKEDVDLADRILKREEEHPINIAWAREFAKLWKSWVDDWKLKAKRYGIPFVKVEYLYQDWHIIAKCVRDLGYIETNYDLSMKKLVWSPLRKSTEDDK